MPDTAEAGATPRIRRARRHEIEDLKDLIARIHAEVYAPPSVDVARYVAEAKAKADKGHRFWWTYILAEVDGRVVGVAQTVNGILNALYVRESARGRGVGAALLAAAEAAMRAKGVTRASVRAADGHPRVVAFYRKHGWQLIGPAEDRPSDAQWDARLLEMTKQLGAVDEKLHRRSTVLLKTALIVGALAVSFGMLDLMRPIGAMPKEASVIIRGALAFVAIRYVLNLRSSNFGFRRNLILSAAGAALYLLSLVATLLVGWLGLIASGLAGQPEGDQTMTSLLVLCALLIVMQRPAHILVGRFWQRFV